MSLCVSKVESEGAYRGFPYAVVFIDSGYRCGYAGVGRNYPSADAWARGNDINRFKVHGGISFSERGIHGTFLHKDFVWLGFDCGHSCDGIDLETLINYGLIEDSARLEAVRAMSALKKDCEIRTLGYVEDECKKLIDQIIASKHSC